MSVCLVEQGGECKVCKLGVLLIIGYHIDDTWYGFYDPSDQVWYEQESIVK